MNVVQQVNEILMRSINAEDDRPDLDVLALESELHDVKHKALDLSMRCENLMRKCTDQFQMIQDQQEVIDKLRRRLKDAGLS